MDKSYVFRFLKSLSQNNSKEWMDAHREEYHQAKQIWLNECALLLDRLTPYNPEVFGALEPKHTISRINNNRRFHPNKPIYKDYFTFSIMDKTVGYSYMHLSVGAESAFLGCGFHQLDKPMLEHIRAAIDYDGDQLKAVLGNEEFQDFYGGLSDWCTVLKTGPRNYAKDHPHKDLLRYKNFIVSRDLQEAEVIRADFVDMVEEAYRLSLPFQTYLTQAVAV